MKLNKFRVQNYRNILDSGWIDIGQLNAFVGQNESGKSNLFEALYRINPFDKDDTYDISEDWPVDDWGGRDEEARVCTAYFRLDPNDIAALFKAALKPIEPTTAADGTKVEVKPPAHPKEMQALVISSYSGLDYDVIDAEKHGLDPAKARSWLANNLPKIVFVREYEMSGAQVELDQLATRKAQHGWAKLSVEDQTILTVLDLAKINLAELMQKGQSPDGRTERTIDTTSASAYLSKQFSTLWSQKKVRFDIKVDHNTLNIFVVDEGVDMPVRLKNRSTGFRWHVTFAWKFTHASKGQFANCIILLEEPGVHLHYDGQRDLLRVLTELSVTNQIMYSSHLASMLDPANPERVRIVEVHDHHSKVISGVVSGQKSPMAVIEARLGLRNDLSSLLETRRTLIVEGGDDIMVLQKLSGLMREEGKHLADEIYLWPAEGASKTPMYAGFMVGQGWEAGVLLDSDEAGNKAKQKITDLYLKDIADGDGKSFRIMQIGEAAGLSNTDAAIEDLFPAEFYLECVNEAYGYNIQSADLPSEGSDMVTKRVESVLKARHGQSELDKQRVLRVMLKKFDSWTKASDLPGDTKSHAEKLFKKINAGFGIEEPKKVKTAKG